MKNIMLVALSFVCVANFSSGEDAINDGLSNTVKSAQQNRTNILALNAERAKLGLREIGVHWVLYRSLDDQEDWKMSRTGFLAKSVFKDESGAIRSEEDYYYSGRQYTDFEGHGWERITVHFDFVTKEVTLSYTGTNLTVRGTLSSFKTGLGKPSSDMAGAIKVVRSVVKGWPNDPKP